MNNQILTLEEFIKLYKNAPEENQREIERILNAPEENQEAVARILSTVNIQNQNTAIN